MNLQLTKKFSISFFLLLLITVGGFAQVRSVTGQITDVEGKPVSGVTVSVKGTAGNVISDKEGKWRVMASPDQIVEFSHIAYTSKEVKVGNHPTIDVMLTKADAQLDDVIVIGYGSQRQKNITGSVVNVNLSRLTDQPVATITEALRGQVPGLQVTDGGKRPGVNASLNIRQQFNWGKDGGNTNPLIVIDDVIQLDPSTGLSSMDRFNLLDLSEVESITVLRDAAAAIYGSRASQGAIVIKTKRGKLGAPRINYAGKFETNDAVGHTKVMNAYEYGLYANKFGRALGSWKPENFFSNDELERMKSLNYDWLDNAWKRANAMQHSLTVSGGSDRATYFMGGSYYTQGANLGSQDYNRYTFRAGTDVTVANGLKVSATIAANNFDLQKSFTKININDPFAKTDGEQSDYSILKFTPKYIPWIYNINGVDQYVSPAMGPQRVLGNVNSNQSLGNTNYFALLNNGSKTTTKTFGYSANFSAQYDIPFVKGLSVKGTYSLQSSAENTEQDMMPQTLSLASNTASADRHLYDTGTKWNAPAVNKSGSRVSYQNSNGTTEQMNFFVNYDRSFGDHNISAVLSGEREKNAYESRTQLYDNPLPGVYNGTSTSAGTLNASNSNTTRTESGTLSYLGRLSYNYRSKYLFQFVFRQDASSRFAPANYWGFFPSVSAGWVISDEDWFKDRVGFVNFLKIRGSFGKTGNDNVKPWKWLQLYGYAPDKGMGFGGVSTGGLFSPGIAPEASPNPDIKWDRTIQRNIGLDFSVLRNRLSVNIDHYFNTTSDALTAMSGAIGAPVSAGGAYAEQNYSSFKWWGTEVTATWKDRIANKIDYTVSMNFGVGDNKTTKYFDQPFAYPSQMTTRKDVGQSSTNTPAWGYRTWKETSGGDGMLRTNEDIDNYWTYLTDHAAKSGVPGAAPNFRGITAKSGLKKGMLVYEDVGGALDAATRTYGGPNGQVQDNEDYVMLKKNTRSYGIATNLSFGYKGVTLAAQILTSWGGGLNQIDLIKQGSSSSIAMWAQPVYMNDMYDDSLNVNGKYPSLAFSDDYGGNNSDYWTVSSFRMYVRSLSLGYTLPRNMVRRARLESAKVYLTGNNLWDFYNPYPGKYRNMYDGPLTGYPTLRTWALGVNLGF